MSLWSDSEPNPKEFMDLPKKKKPRISAPAQKQEEVSTKSLFTRGYGEIREKLSKRSRFTMSCFNCHYFYQAVGDKEEVCQNPDVLKYDMVVTETSIYCNRWEMTKRKQSAKSLFRGK